MPAPQHPGSQASMQPHAQEARVRLGWAQPLVFLLGKGMAPRRLGTKGPPQQDSTRARGLVESAVKGPGVQYLLCHSLCDLRNIMSFHHLFFNSLKNILRENALHTPMCQALWMKKRSLSTWGEPISIGSELSHPEGYLQS